MAKRELASLRSEKTILLALAIQLFIAAFSSFLVVGLVSLYDPGATQGAQTIELGISGEASEEIDRLVDAGTAREAIVYETREDTLEAFGDRQIDGVLIATHAEDSRIHIEAVAPEGDFRTTLVVTQIREALLEVETERRGTLSSRLERQPLTEPPQPDANPYFGFTYTILVPVLVFLPAFISGSIASDSLAEEIERNTLELLRVAPLSIPEIVDGKALTMVAIAPAQAALWLVFLELNGTHIARPIEILVLVAAMTGILVVIGATLAIVIGIRREAQLLYSLLALALFGGFLLLPETLPTVVAKLAIGSPTHLTYGTVGVLVIAAGFGYVAIRRLAGGVTME